MKTIVYLYNYIFSAIIFNSVNNNIISPNNSILNDTDIGCFSLISHKKYLYLRVYRCRVYIYIPQNL